MFGCVAITGTETNVNNSLNSNLDSDSMLLRIRMDESRKLCL